MTDDTRWITALRSSHARFAGLVDGLTEEQVTGPSYDDDEWTIADVSSHLGSQAEIFRPFLEAGLTGDQPPGNDSFAPIWDRWNAMAPADQVRESVARNEELVERLEALDDDQRASFRVPLFGSEQDLAGFAAMRLGEHAVHTWDVAVALDPTATVSADAVDLLIDGWTPGSRGSASRWPERHPWSSRPRPPSVASSSTWTRRSPPGRHRAARAPMWCCRPRRCCGSSTGASTRRIRRSQWSTPMPWRR